MAKNKSGTLEISSDEALQITTDTLLSLVQKGVYRMTLTTDNDIEIEITMIPHVEE